MPIDSPFAPLQAWMLQAWARYSGSEARVRSWSVDRERAMLSLTLGPENRWCAHVQRFHRSNGTPAWSQTVLSRQ